MLLRHRNFCTFFSFCKYISLTFFYNVCIVVRKPEDPWGSRSWRKTNFCLSFITEKGCEGVDPGDAARSARPNTQTGEFKNCILG